MAIQWSGLGPELLLRLDRGSGLPLRSQLEDGIRDAIRDGRLQPGERLPSSREFARELRVSRGLVQECYGQLLSEGYLDSQVGSATRVAARAYPAASPAPRSSVPAPPPRLIADFRSGVPDLASFPRGDWVWAMREACREVATAELDYGDPRGSAALREVLAAYLRRVRAAAARPEDLVVMLQGIAPDRVFTLGTVSKSLAPSVRLGWVLAPPALSGAVAEAKLLPDRGTSGLDQLALAALLSSGRYDRHLRKMRGVYARRRAALIGALARHAPEVRLTGLAAGFHAVAHLPDAADEDAVVAEALRRSVGLYGMAPFRAIRGAAPPQLVLGFGLTGERAIEAGIAAVAGLLR